MNLIENIQLIESYKNITLCLSFTVLRPLNEKKIDWNDIISFFAAKTRAAFKGKQLRHILSSSSDFLFFFLCIWSWHYVLPGVSAVGELIKHMFQTIFNIFCQKNVIVVCLAKPTDKE
jgi:hypothetical protein